MKSQCDRGHELNRRGRNSPHRYSLDKGNVRRTKGLPFSLEKNVRRTKGSGQSRTDLDVPKGALISDCRCVNNPPDKIRDFATLPYTGRALKSRNVDIITMAPLCKGSCFCLQKLRGCYCEVYKTRAGITKKDTPQNEECLDFIYAI